MKTPRLFLIVVLLLAGVLRADADVIVRWDQSRVPSRESLGISSVLIPAANGDAIRAAAEYGYSIYLEIEAAQAASFTPPIDRIAGVVVKGEASAAQLAPLRKRLDAGARVLVQDERGKWPHIRLNWVTKRNDVLQVSSRTAQPWIENNAALIRMARTEKEGLAPLLTYEWQPITVADAHEGPALENYLVAIAEAGSFGADLVLPLYETFQQSLLLGRPAARAWWSDIRRAIEFYSWNLPRQYRFLANVGVVAENPMAYFEVYNLLMRHNVPVDVIAPASLPTHDVTPLQVLVVLDQPAAAQIQALSAFANRGGTVVLVNAKGKFPWHDTAAVATTEQQATYKAGEGRVIEVLNPVVDPNAFALDIRQLLGDGNRVVDIWNGITVLAAPYEDPGGNGALLTLLNYSHEPIPVQLRIRGTYSLVHYEAPGQEPVLLPYHHRDGYTEFVVPALRIGGRVFLSDEAESNTASAQRAVKPDRFPGDTAYSFAVWGGDTLHLTSQPGRDPVSGTVPDGVGAQTKQAMENIGEILRTTGLDHSHLVKCRVYLRSMDDYKEMNQAYRSFFPDRVPARTTVQAAALAQPSGVEIACIAFRDRERISVVTPPAGSLPTPLGPYSPGVWAGDTLYLSGMGGEFPADRRLPEPLTDQVKQTLVNIQTTLKAAGLGLADVVSSHVYLTVPEQAEDLTRAYAEVFDEIRQPPRSLVFLPRLPGETKTEITFVAARGGERQLYTRLESAPKAGADFDAQFREVLSRLRRTVETAGMRWSDVLSLQVYLSNVSDLERMDRIFREVFAGGLPARTAVGANHPDGTQVSAALIAVAGR